MTATAKFPSDREKACFKCGETKPLTEFYKHPMMADGHLGKCKECAKADMKRHRKENPEIMRARDRDKHQRSYWSDPEASRQRSRERYQQNRESVSLYKAMYVVRNQKVRFAHVALGNAVRSGKVVRGPCEACGSPDSQGHHDDYDKPLEVRWLCPRHHAEWHFNNGPGKNRD